LTALFRPCATALLSGAKTLPLHPVAQLLLTAAQQITPASYQHALRATALAGALAWHVKAPTAFLQRAMLVGLLHDIGEMYVNPEYLRAGRQLDLGEYRQLAAHPHVGAMLLTQMTDYPPEIARAVSEHHERLDGTGYPFQRLGASLSPLGQLMSVAELALGIVDQQPHAAARASFALKFVPGELSGLWAGPLTHWADTEPSTAPDAAAADAAIGQLGTLDGGLQRMQAMAESVAESVDGAAQRVAQRAAHRLRRLRIAWNAMGLWSLPESEIEPQERFDIALAMRELRYRIGTIGRDCLWPETDQTVQADARLVPLWLTLASAGKR
jgi:HD domain